jgi:hypothetical protein
VRSGILAERRPLSIWRLKLGRGMQVGERRVARLMRQAGLVSI